MALYDVYFDRTESCVVRIEAENKEEAKEKWMEADWSLDNERHLGTTSKIKKVIKEVAA